MRPDLEDWIPPGSPDHEALLQVDLGRLPRHVAIIMDGNGRWARRRGQPRVHGHRAGVQAVREVVECSARLGLEALTLFAFSRENWKRPPAEVETLMGLLAEFLWREMPELDRHDLRFRVLGRPQDLPAAAQRALRAAVERTAGHRGMQLGIALSYSGRSEIVEACNALLREREAGRLEGPVSEEDLARHLQTAGLPDPDLLIRTSGENRVSNFLLWQIAYAEIWLTDKLWPDFRRGDLLRAIADFQRRERRYGGA